MRKYKRQWIEEYAEHLWARRGDALRLMRNPSYFGVRDVGEESFVAQALGCLALAREFSRGRGRIFSFDPDAYEEIVASESYGSELEALETYPWGTSYIEVRGEDSLAGMGIVYGTDILEVITEIGAIPEEFGYEEDGLESFPVPRHITRPSESIGALSGALATDFGKMISAHGFSFDEGTERLHDIMEGYGANLIAFLAASNTRDLVDLEYRPSPEVKKRAASGKSTPKHSALDHYQVGARLGMAIRVHKRDIARAEASGGSGSISPKVPHAVRGHWSKRRHGPRDDWHYEPCYISPYFTGLNGGDGMRNVIHRVTL